MRRWPGWLVAVLAMAAPIVWEVGLGIAAQLADWRLSELEALSIAKLGFALLLAAWLTLFGRWREAGFLSGWQFGRWWLLWPLWVAAALSTLSGRLPAGVLPVLAWFAVAAAVGFGEEGIFRGVMFAALARSNPRRAALVGAFLFGVMHLAGLIAPIDPRMIVGQAVVAFGLGLVLGGTRLCTGSIWPGIAAHTMLDFIGLAGAGSLTDAMQYSPGAIAYMLGAATIAALWGLVLIFRLTRPGAAGGDRQAIAVVQG